MVLRLNETLKIEDLRNHSAESVETLRTLLRTGAPALPDPRRRGFYEVDNCSRVFYIHITPRGNVWLLAIWTKNSALAAVNSDGCAAAVPAWRQQALSVGASGESEGVLHRAHHTGG